MRSIGFLICLFVVGFLLINFKVSSIIEQKTVEKMEYICNYEYNQTYSHHNQFFFWCYSPAINESFDVRKIQWNGDWDRPFEHEADFSELIVPK